MANKKGSDSELMRPLMLEGFHFSYPAAESSRNISETATLSMKRSEDHADKIHALFFKTQTPKFSRFVTLKEQLWE